MTRPIHPAGGAQFDLVAAEREMRAEGAYLRDGHTARTLVREPDLRITLVVMRAGARIAEHHTDETASVHASSGHILLHLPDKAVELRSGALFILEKGLPHSVEAIEDSAFLLTLGWRGA